MATVVAISGDSLSMNLNLRTLEIFDLNSSENKFRSHVDLDKESTLTLQTQFLNIECTIHKWVSNCGERDGCLRRCL